MIETFKTQDGKLFTEKQEALKHEDKIFNEWLATNPMIPVTEFLRLLDDTEVDEWYATETVIGRGFVRKYWETMKPDYLMNQVP